MLFIIGIWGKNKIATDSDFDQKIVYNHKTKLLYIINKHGDTSGVINSTPNQALVLSHGDTTRWGLGNRVKYYTTGGALTSTMKTWVGIITPSSSSGYSVDISSAGFSTILSIQVQALNNTNTVTSMPMVTVQSYTTSAVVISIITSNNATIASLLSPIIGLVTASSLSGTTLHVRVDGY